MMFDNTDGKQDRYEMWLNSMLATAQEAQPDATLADLKIAYQLQYVIRGGWEWAEARNGEFWAALIKEGR